MMLCSILDVATVKPAVEVADIFRLHFGDYLKQYHCTPEEFAAVNAIIACRTATAGGFIRQCDQCGKCQISYCSCGNRNCPKCGAFAKAQWLAQQEARLLPVPHFQVVFTLDHLINDLAYVNPKAIYDLLFATANQVLKEFAQRYLGGKVGVTAVLHTWGQTVQHHIHLHCMVTGGALVSTADGYRWQKTTPGFLFPAIELSATFRAAFCQGLRRLAKRGKLRLVGPCANLDLEKLVQTMERKAWELFVGKPPKDAQVVDLLGYFSRYVYRTAITNQRLLKIGQGEVTFEYYNNHDKAFLGSGQAKGQKKVMTLSAGEFIRRFLRHVLPSGYHRVRHFGLYAGSQVQLLAIRLLLGDAVELTQQAAPKLDMRTWLAGLGLVDPLRCPFCGEGTLHLVADFASLRLWQCWLLLWLGIPLFGKEVA